ncbi:HpcH/HpaI aldolase family protein [Natrononativus amylolyticus]|uniref:HpcH/HpaI aldolase family protein n=1 Tax=Natrononativus amylolyticus TaxID=2963434 RepID=UPI0020CF4053|nr:aldolase/citrate lyase family protein [Natrononativus amylolyticus]
MDDASRPLLNTDEHAVGNWISIGHPTVAEVCARGFDFVIIDTEHTPTGLESLENSLRAVEALEEDVTPFVRVPWNDPVRIKRVLDLGVAGLMIPMIETAEGAERAVEAMRYPPEGVRGAAPARASDYGRTFSDYFETANEQLTTIVQIETERGVENAAEIVAVDGVDAVIVGHGDLSASLGVFGEWESERFQTALQSVIDVAHDADTPVGMLATDRDGIHRWIDVGVDFVIVGMDIAYLAEASDAARAEFEKLTRSDKSH